MISTTIGARRRRALRPPHLVWYEISRGGQKIGHMTNGVWPYRMKRNVGYALVAVDAQPGERVELHRGGKTVGGVLCELPFLDLFASPLRAERPVR